MMNLHSLSPKTIAHITRGAVYFEQHYYHDRDGWGDSYRFKVTYPNGFGASIFWSSLFDETDVWEVTLFQGDCDDFEDGNGNYCLTEEEVNRACDMAYSFG